MIQVDEQLKLREHCFGAEVFSPVVQEWIIDENLWNIWVPKAYGGLELSLSQGLDKLKELARIDGSLGWTITLCSGANYFIGNLQQCKSQEIFLDSESAPCLGGSGGVYGTAEKINDHYKISGKWHYATGAPYLSHFTLNAEIIEDGKKLLNKDGSPTIKSFVIPKNIVRIIEDWNTMGLRATATHSFEVKDQLIHENCSFQYNKYHLSHPVFKIPFSVFADLTLWVNYIGMAEHLLEEAKSLIPERNFEELENTIAFSNQKIDHFSQNIEEGIGNNMNFKASYVQEIHNEASNSVKCITSSIVAIFPYLGVKASRNDEQINQIFCDYFTATQHHIFTRK
ncbi:acyl-CoA dehydrogenase [Arenibacter aquaticus]|uniref:Acyl-CoA dehydrogenase n=1 Tax=Arenibacter aquaticus TaxID=2489054 RepID=A0A430JZT4_9FLAO|nr:acyl-CoA dehydrogenase [Arenibacter aquaticus]RTE52429.1 acyl-CoA dehydrogenase [Arenibacter aquaticus]